MKENLISVTNIVPDLKLVCSILYYLLKMFDILHTADLKRKNSSSFKGPLTKTSKNATETTRTAHMSKVLFI